MDFRVGVSVELLDRMSSGLTHLVRGLDQAHRSATSLQKTLHSIELQMSIGRGLTHVGFTIAGGLMAAASAAGKLEVALKGVQVVGNFTAQQMQGIQSTVFKLSAETALSARQVAEIAAQVMRGTGFRDPAQLQAVLPTLTKFADVQFLTRGIGLKESTELGVRFAHMFGSYKPAALEQQLDTFYKASKMSVGGPQDLMASLRQFAPTARSLGMDPNQAIVAATLFENLGLTSGGGTALKNLLLYSLPGSASITGHRQSKRTGALESLGILSHGKSTIMEGGHVDFMAMIERLQNASHHMSKVQFATTAQAAFNMRGMSAAQLLAMPENLDRLNELVKNFQRMSGIKHDQEAFFNTFEGQMQNLRTNLENVFNRTLLPALPKITSTVSLLADKAAHLTASITPEKAMLLVKIGAAISGIAITAGAITQLSAIARLVRVLGGLAGAEKGMGAFGVQKVWVVNMPGGGMPGAGAGGGGSIPGIGGAGAIGGAAESLSIRQALGIAGVVYGGLKILQAAHGAHVGGRRTGEFGNDPNIEAAHDQFMGELGGRQSRVNFKRAGLMGRPAGMLSERAVNLIVHNNIAQQPGESTEKLAERVAHHTTKKLQQHLRSSGPASGVNESPLVNP